MSKETAKVIVERMAREPKFADEVGRCKSFDALQRFFTGEGLSVTERELIEQLSALTDDSLEQVAGGGIQHRHLSCGQLFQDFFRRIL